MPKKGRDPFVETSVDEGVDPIQVSHQGANEEPTWQEIKCWCLSSSPGRVGASVSKLGSGDPTQRWPQVEYKWAYFS
jgi:hypothetical protein